MASRQTDDLVQRVLPLLATLAPTSLDRARLLQWFSGMTGVSWGVMDLVGPAPPLAADEARRLVVRDRASGAEHVVIWPASVDPAIERLACEEYQRLALARPLTLMGEPLFAALFGASHCAHCRWRGEEFAAFHRECRYAGRPVNFEEEKGA